MRKLCFILYLSYCSTLFSAAISWDGGNGTNLWSDGKNWTGDVLPGIADDVTISGATVLLDMNTQIYSLTLSGGAKLTTGGATTLTINGIGTQAVMLNNASALIEGTLLIPLYNGNGILIDASSDMTNDGIISANNIGGYGIHVQGTFDNNGKCSFGLIGSITAIIEGDFTNTDTLSITSVDSTGILCRMTGSLTNSGEISINGATRIGLELRNSAKLTNQMTGVIDITGIQEGAFTTRGIQMLGTPEILNQGEIRVHDIVQSQVNVGIQAYHRVDNQGSIYLYNVGSQVMNIIGYLKNTGTIECLITGMPSVGFRAINIIDTLENSNSGKITIVDSTDFRMDGIILGSSNSLLLNQDAAIIELINLSDPLTLTGDSTTVVSNNDASILVRGCKNGVLIEDGSQFGNSGYVEIVRTGQNNSTSALTIDNAIFRNTILGTLLIDSTTGPDVNGILNASNAEFVNRGSITVKHITGPAAFANILSSTVDLYSGSTTTVSFNQQNSIDASGGNFHVKSGAVLTIEYDGSSGSTLFNALQNFIVDGIFSIVESP